MRNNPRETILTLHRRHARAWERRNLEEMRLLYAEEVVVFSTEPPAKFSDFRTFENNLQHYFSLISEVSFITSNIQIELTADMALVTSLYLKAFRENDQMKRESGRWTEVYRQVSEGRWQLIHFHASRDPG